MATRIAANASKKSCRSLRIIYLHPHFTTDGGAGRMVIETGKRLVDRGHQVHCVCIRVDREITGSNTGISFHEIGGPLSSKLLFWLRFHSGCQRVTEVVQQIVANNADGECILFPQVFPSNWWGSHVYKRMAGIPCIWYCHEPSAFMHSAQWIGALPWPKNLIARLLNPLLRRRDLQYCRVFQKVLVNSNYSRTYTQQVYGFNDDRCEVAYLGYDPEAFNADGVEARERWVVCVAKLTRFKNVDCLIDAIKHMVDKGDSDLQLHIVGTGDAMEELEQQTLRLALRNQIVFHGRLTDCEMVSLLRKSRGLCLASQNEPFGLVAIEAMACGTPVIAVDNGGPKEILADSFAGILVPSGAAHEFASAIKKVLNCDETFQAMSQAALRRASDFSWDKTVDYLEAAFQRCPN